MKNKFSYNCIRKPNIIQRNINDCMELRCAEIRSHIVIRRTSRVYSLCVFRLLQHRHPGRDRIMSTSSPPSSFTVVPPAPNPHHMWYSNPRYMLHSNPRHMLYSNPRHMLYLNPRHMFIRILVTCYIRIHH